MSRTRSAGATKTHPLPSYIQEKDLAFDYKKDKRPKEGFGYGPNDVPYQFTLHLTERFGWVVTTLLIRKAGRRHASGAQDRTYAWSLDNEKPCRVGLGPHILRTVRVEVKVGNAKRLQPLFDQYEKGMIATGNWRDRRSTGRGPRRGRGLFDFLG